MDTNYEEYKTQLLSVEKALLASQDTEERTALEALRCDLLELLELTRQSASTHDISTNNEDELGNEMQRFMEEIGQLNPTEEKEMDEKEDSCDEVVLNLTELEQMIGQKCSAPHMHAWGALSYHNAIICGIGDNVAGDDDVSDVKLRVLFTNPTHREMLPCAYYLEGECRFDETRCHYSHGELVSARKIRSYSDPDFERLGRNCIVLAKLKDRLWHRGRVLCANFIEKTCRVRLDGKTHKEREMDLPFEDLFPISQDEDLSSDSNSDSTVEFDSEELDDFETARRARMVELSLFTFRPTQPLGEWEKHTRGIGSKLMAKMGYIHGTGLGSDGRGIVTPVSAQILPQGRSLDHCMELREAANGDQDLFSVEKKLQRDQKKQEALNAKAYERASQRVNVFSFLNDNIFGQKPSEAVLNTKKDKINLQQQTTKSLNVESVRVADEIRRKEREIAKVHDSIKRNVSGTEIYKRLQLELNALDAELQALRKTENCLSREQASRKTKTKLTVF